MRNIDLAPDGDGAGNGRYYTVAGRIERLSLTDAKVGDIVKELSDRKYFLLTALPASDESNWKTFFAILNSGIPIIQPVAGTADIDFIEREVAQVTLDCNAETSAVTVNVSPYPFFAQVIEVRFGPTAVNLNFGGLTKQAGGGGGIVAGIANSTMLITVYSDA